MTLLYRFLIAVLARLVMIGLGGLFLYGASFYVGLLLNPVTRAAIRGDVPSGAPEGTFALAVCLGVGFSAVGGALVFFGLRGLWRRLRAGLPSSDEGRAETASGRVASAAVFGAGALLGLLKLSLLSYSLADQAELAWTGAEATAVVERKWSGNWQPPGSDQPASLGDQIAIAFQTEDGRLVRSEHRISPKLYRAVEESGSVRVTYARENPARLQLEFATLSGVLSNLAVWLGLVTVGLWGVRRNLGRDDPDGPVARAPRIPVAAEPSRPLGTPKHSPPAAARRSFGQRTG